MEKQYRDKGRLPGYMTTCNSVCTFMYIHAYRRHIYEFVKNASHSYEYSRPRLWTQLLERCSPIRDMDSLHVMVVKAIAASWSSLATNRLKRGNRVGDISAMSNCFVSLRMLREKPSPYLSNLFLMRNQPLNTLPRAFSKFINTPSLPRRCGAIEFYHPNLGLS